MFLLFLPFVIVIALVVGAVALVSSTGAWPLLLIVLGLWLLTRQGDRRLSTYPEARGWHRRPGRPRGWEQAPRAEPAPPPAARQEPEAPRPERAPTLPVDLQAKADRIRQKVDALLAHAERFPPYSPDLYLVRQTGADYLPATVSAYLSLPEGAAERVVDATGKTAHQELGEQLDLLDAKLDEIAAHLHARELDPLLANRQFLEQRLVSQGDEIGPGGTATEAG